MSQPGHSATAPAGTIYWRDTLIKGQPARIECFDLQGQTFVINRGPLTTVSLEDEWYEDMPEPARVIEALRNHPEFKPDIFTFWQRLPDVEPKHQFPMEWEEIAVLPVKSYDHWWNHQIKSRTRTLIRKSQKEGVVVRECDYDDAFVRGMTAIFNEAPVRQGRKFWHYGKDFDTVKHQFARYIHRERMIGAYHNGEMIGLIMLGCAGSFGLTGQIISSLKHRDKAPNNALIAKAVEVCEQRGLPALVYLFWSDDSLSEFKRRCGFEPVKVPRYYVPLTPLGRLGYKCGAHRSWRAMIPKRIKAPLKQLRQKWNERRGG